MTQDLSIAELLASVPASEQQQYLAELAPTPTEAQRLEYAWSFWGRPKQLPPPHDWRYWLLLAGRGFGKTRALAEWVCMKAEQMPGSRGAIIASTAADARDIVVEGESGILAVSPPWNKPTYEGGRRRIIWPNGTTATLYTAVEPDRLRGPQHHWAACDELAAWRYVDDAWSNLLFGLRLGESPQCVVATTPRPIPIIRSLLADPATAITRGSTYENVGNLAPAFIKEIIKRYEGTRLGRQELEAEILDDTPGALWNREILEQTRRRLAPSLVRIVVGVDPEISDGEESAETGIIVAGIDENDHGYTLADETTKGSPAAWGKAVVLAYDRFAADCVVAEVNNGGEMVEYVIKTAARDLFLTKERKSAYINVKNVRASRGKFTRAEPVAALYEQGRCHHTGMFPYLEDQLCSWVPGDVSPDRLDALVWAYTELLLEERKPRAPVKSATAKGWVRK